MMPFLILSKETRTVSASALQKEYYTSCGRVCMDLEFRSNPWYFWKLRSRRVHENPSPMSAPKAAI